MFHNWSSHCQHLESPGVVFQIEVSIENVHSGSKTLNFVCFQSLPVVEQTLHAIRDIPVKVIHAHGL